MSLSNRNRLAKSLHRLMRGLCLAFALAANTAYAQEAPRRQKNRPNFRTLAREYQDVDVNGRKFIVEKQLLDEDPRTAKTALARLDKNINIALALLPPHAHRHVAKQQFWLMYGESAAGGGESSGLVYFRPGAPRFDDNRDERWESAVIVYCASNYTKLSDLWALKSVLHELGHAYHLEQWPEREPDILAAYENAMRKDLYRNVKGDRRGVFERAYATTNQLEYFAELTCMFFAQANYEPYHRQGLKEYDPEGYEMIRKLWKVGPKYGQPEPRTWTIGSRGSRFEGVLKELRNGRVTITDSKGRDRTLALTLLSPLDQEHVASWFDE